MWGNKGEGNHLAEVLEAQDMATGAYHAAAKEIGLIDPQNTHNIEEKDSISASMPYNRGRVKEGVCEVRLFVILLSLVAFPTLTSAAELFSDKNERFVASIPSGWKCRDEGELARSKVICLTPDGGQNYIRFIVSASPNTSLNDFANETRSKIPNLQKRISGSSFSVTIQSYGENQAVYLKSNVGLEVASIVEDGWVYNVNFNYSSAAKGQKYREDFQNVVASLIPLAKKSTVEGFESGFVERQRRLAELYMSLGETEDAWVAVEEGLEISKDDPKLLELKLKLESSN